MCALAHLYGMCMELQCASVHACVFGCRVPVKHTFKYLLFNNSNAKLTFKRADK